MKKFRTAAALILALALALSLAGCGTAMSDASAMLVQGNLDGIYLGKFDPRFPHAGGQHGRGGASNL